MIGEADREIRLRTFDWLTRQRDEFGETISRTALETFSLDGRRIPLVGPSGIWKPAAASCRYRSRRPSAVRTTTASTAGPERFATPTADSIRSIETTAACGARWSSGSRSCTSTRSNPGVTWRPIRSSSSGTGRSSSASRCRSMTSTLPSTSSRATAPSLKTRPSPGGRM